MSKYAGAKGDKGKAKLKGGFDAPRGEPVLVPRFAMDEIDRAMAYLDENGYVVLRNVASETEVSKGLDLAWSYVEGLGHGIKRDDPKTWATPAWPDPFRKGIIAADGVGQSEFMWFCRGLENVQQIYKSVWKVDSLITSFDGFCFHRAYEYNEKWRTSDAAWYHTDQNGVYKPDKVCVQGFLNFCESGVDDGGLVVVPGSQKLFKRIFEERKDKYANRGDFIPLTEDKALWTELKKAGLSPIKVCCGPGDFVLWDSRTIHCNAPARTLRSLPKDGTLLPPRRIVAYVCMTPASRLTEETHANRIQSYLNGDTTSHWPEEVFTPSVRKNGRPNYKPIELSDSLKKLIPLL